jgi:rubrerythrin
MNEDLITEKLSNLEKKLDEIIKDTKAHDGKVDNLIEKHDERIDNILLRVEKNEAYIKGVILGFSAIFTALVVLLYTIYSEDKASSISYDKDATQQFQAIKEHERAIEDRLLKLEFEKGKR